MRCGSRELSCPFHRAVVKYVLLNKDAGGSERNGGDAAGCGAACGGFPRGGVSGAQRKTPPDLSRDLRADPAGRGTAALCPQPECSDAGDRAEPGDGRGDSGHPEPLFCRAGQRCGSSGAGGGVEYRHHLVQRQKCAGPGQFPDAGGPGCRGDSSGPGQRCG